MPAPQEGYGFLNGSPATRSLEFRSPAGELLVEVQTWFKRDDEGSAGDCTLCDWQVDGSDRAHVDAEAKAHFNNHLNEKGLR